MSIFLRTRTFLQIFFIFVLGVVAFFVYTRYWNEAFDDGDSGKMLQKLDFQKIMEMQQAKTAWVVNTCKHLNLKKSFHEIPLDHLDHFIVDDIHKFIYCFVPKVATTNWKRVLMVLNSVNNQQNPLAIKGNETNAPNMFKTLSQFSLAEAHLKLQTYFKFLFVRHPFERLLSAYRNKFEKTYTDYFLHRYGRKIIKLYRSNATQESLDKGNDVTFSEFVRYVVELNTQSNSAAFNEHWRPMVDLCFPCAVNFDCIGKYETLEIDASFVLSRLGISNKVMFPNRDQTYKTLPTSELLNAYYKALPPHVLDRLVRVYSNDFQLFNYSSRIVGGK